MGRVIVGRVNVGRVNGYQSDSSPIKPYKGIGISRGILSKSWEMS